MGTSLLLLSQGHGWGHPQGAGFRPHSSVSALRRVRTLTCSGVVPTQVRTPYSSVLQRWETPTPCPPGAEGPGAEAPGPEAPGPQTLGAKASGAKAPGSEAPGAAGSLLLDKLGWSADGPPADLDAAQTTSLETSRCLSPAPDRRKQTSFGFGHC